MTSCLRICILISALATASLSCVYGDSGNRPLTSFDLKVARLVSDPARGLIYASLTESNNVVVIDPATMSIVKTLSVGLAPVGMSISADGTKLYVALSGATQIGVINLSTLGVLPSLTIEQQPYEIAAGLGNRLYVTQAHFGVLLQVDALTGASEGTVYDPSAAGFLQISSDRKTLYFAESLVGPSPIRSFDVSNPTAVPLQTGGDSNGFGIDLTLSHNGQFLCLTGAVGGTATSLIDATNFNNILGSFVADNRAIDPSQLAFSPDDATVYEYNGLEPNLFVFSSASFLQLGTLESGDDPNFPQLHQASDLVVDASGRYLFLAEDSTLWVYDLFANPAPTVSATVGQDFSYQAPIHIATTSAFATGLPPGLSFDPESRTISGVPSQAGSFPIIITAADGTHTITVNLGLFVFENSRALNISTRAEVQSGDNVLIAGFIILGTEPKDVAVRAIGPSLPVTGALANPLLELHDSSGALIDSNDDWATDGFAIAISADGLAPKNPAESAMYRILNPGAYTVVIRGADGGSGPALAEVYDLSSFLQTRLANISTRGTVATNDSVMIGGFITSGPDNSSMLIRAIGPSLADHGVTGSLNDPQLDLYNSDGVKIASNNNWRDSQEAEIEASGLAPTDDRESAISINLMPGGYTAIVSGVNASTGVGLVEAYNLP
jgi:YVTN family beta-propeller protein